MSQQQPRRPEQEQDRAIKYGDVFAVAGNLANQPIAPGDASMMQSAEQQVLGCTQKGGAAATMQSAASHNERAGVVGHFDTYAGDQEGMTVAETDVPGKRFVTESVDGQVVEQYSLGTEPLAPAPAPSSTATPVLSSIATDQITIGEALEASALTAGDKPIDQADAAAIQAAEVRATRRNIISPGGLGAQAQSAATANERMLFDEDKTKLADVLTDASAKLPTDRPATRRDAEGVTAAEMRNKPDLSTEPGGVAASVAAAARLNQMK